MGKSKLNKKIVIFSYLLLFVVLTHIYISVRIPLFVILSNVVGMILISFLYEGYIPKKILIAIMTFSIFFLIETVVVLSFTNSPINLLNKITADSISLVAITKTITLLISYFVHLFSLKNSSQYDLLPVKYYISFIFMSVATSIIVIVMVTFFGGRNIYIIFSALVLLIMNFIFFILLDDLSNLFEKEHINSRIENKYELLKLQSEIINDSSQELKKLEHDLRNKLAPIAYLAKKEKMDKLNEYINDIIGEFEVVKVFNSTGIIELDSILNVKYSEAKKLGIDFIGSFDLSKNIKINNMDFAVIVGNLLDNAIEGSKCVSDKWIKIKIKESYGVIIINVENSFDGLVKIENGILKSRKSNLKSHGIGIASIKKIIKKYDGDLDFSYSPNVFVSKVFLYGKSNNL